MSSIFSLQSRRTGNADLLAILQESQHRIQSIALLHETLYRSQDFSRIDMKVYLKELARNLSRNYQVDRTIAVELDCENVHLEIGAALPCGLIVNELLSNSFKHAFPVGFVREDKKVVVGVRLESVERVSLWVRDNGVGIQKSIDELNTPSLGLKLLQVLSKQLKGEMTLDGSDGASFHLTFSVEQIHKENEK
jgi:two-component sensor histidine kinase